MLNKHIIMNGEINLIIRKYPWLFAGGKLNYVKQTHYNETVKYTWLFGEGKLNYVKQTYYNEPVNTLDYLREGKLSMLTNIL